VNLHADKWDGVKERKGWRSRYVPVGARVGGEPIGGSRTLDYWDGED